MAARKVLVIEDEAGSRDALESLLAEDGYLVRTAASGHRGLECVGEFHPDTVICDFCLPDIDGLEVLRRLREMAGGVYFIALTAGCGGDEAERELRAEADHFLGKPVNLPQLRSLLAGVGPDAPELAGTVNVLN